MSISRDREPVLNTVLLINKITPKCFTPKVKYRISQEYLICN